MQRQLQRTRVNGPRGTGQGGFTFLGLILAVALLSLGLSVASEVWFTTAHGQRSEQSQWVAQEFVRAIGSYYLSGPAGVKHFPKQLQDLVEDNRSGTVRRHLRQIYLNPYTGRGEWELVPASGGGFSGVRAAFWQAESQKLEWMSVVYSPPLP